MNRWVPSLPCLPFGTESILSLRTALNDVTTPSGPVPEDLPMSSLHCCTAHVSYSSICSGGYFLTRVNRHSLCVGVCSGVDACRTAVSEKSTGGSLISAFVGAGTRNHSTCRFERDYLYHII